MQKALIIILFILISGCSVKRYTANNSEIYQEPAADMIENIMSNNITSEGFYIEKASLSFKMKGEKQKYLFSLKFRKPQNYLLSIKSLTGIEGARILITEDTLLVNDRVGKRLLYGNPVDIEEKAGICADMIGVLFGDLLPAINDKDQMYRDSRTGNTVEKSFGKRVLRSVLDETIGKVSSVLILSDADQPGVNGDSITIRFSKFSKGEKKIPANIEFKDLRRNISGIIKIERFKIPWNEEIEFIAGKGYKMERIK